MSAPPPNYPQFGDLGAPPPIKKSRAPLFIALGCAGVILVGVVVVVALVGGGWYAMSHSQAVTTARTFVEANDDVVSAFGAPVSTTLTSVNFSTVNGDSRAWVAFSTSGPKASGAVRLRLVAANKQDWTVEWVEIQNADGSRVVYGDASDTPPSDEGSSSGE